MADTDLPPPPPEPMEGGAHPDVLPAYAFHDVGAPPDFASVGTVGTLAAQTANLSVSSIDPYSERPSREQVMAHLKFLHAVQALRVSIRAQDGLFNLHDSDIRDAKAPGQADELRKLLSEKRWAVYVARAVERFTAWWNTLRGRIGTQGARLADFEVTGRLDAWVRDGLPEGVIRTKDDLPPLGKYHSGLATASVADGLLKTSSWYGTLSCSIRGAISKIVQRKA